MEAFLISWSNLSEYGEIFKSKDCIVFFGHQNFQLNEINHLIPNHHIMTQFHSDIVIPASQTKKRADGHYTDKKKSALIIKTADCMPVFLEAGDQIIGLHIGWVGLSKKILTQSLKKLKSTQNIKLWVGPHVGQTTYWLKKVSVEKLFKDHKLKKQEALNLGILKPSFEKSGQFIISLKDILLNEAYNLGIKV